MVETLANIFPTLFILFKSSSVTDTPFTLHNLINISKYLNSIFFGLNINFPPFFGIKFLEKLSKSLFKNDSANFSLTELVISQSILFEIIKLKDLNIM